MKKSISEILELVEKAPTRNDKVRLLQENFSKSLVEILQGAFDVRIKWLLPEGPVPYTPNNLMDIEHVLYNRSRELYLFAQGGNPSLTQARREQLFIQFLESLDKKDAQLIVHIKDKKLPYSSITPDIVVEAFPQFNIEINQIQSQPVAVEPKKKGRSRKTAHVEDSQSA
jgi:hypothetical protein